MTAAVVVMGLPLLSVLTASVRAASQQISADLADSPTVTRRNP